MDESSQESRKRDYIILIGAFIFIAGMTALIIWQWPLIRELFSNPEGFRDYVASYGMWAPVVFVIIYVILVISAFGPAYVLNYLSGAMFGFWKGFLLSWAGNVVGAALAIWLGRGVTKSIAHIFFPAKKYQKYVGYVRTRGWAYLLILYAIPNPLGDTLNYVGAASDIEYWKLILMLSIARIPLVIVRTAIGSTMVNFKTIHWIVMIGIFIVIGLTVFLLRRYIDRLAERLAAKIFPTRP
ncbi:TVP38/TMEM64 family protein [candidate division WOR-3 bacterium]|nr:TVP38/TMEM64 family protein [candidate division WOR-3 bacterium]